MQPTRTPIDANESASKPRAAWQTPSVRRMRAGMAEVGFTNTVDDGPGTKS